MGLLICFWRRGASELNKPTLNFPFFLV